jgi:hypothetical protein
MRTKWIYLLPLLNTLSFLTIILAFPNHYMAEMVFAGIVILLMSFASGDAASLKLAIVYFLLAILAASLGESLPVLSFLLPFLFPCLAAVSSLKKLNQEVGDATL